MAIIKSNLDSDPNNMNDLKAYIQKGIKNGISDINATITLTQLIKQEALKVLADSQDDFKLSDDQEQRLYTLAFNDGVLELEARIIKLITKIEEASDGNSEK